jgi:hypothetical protein
MATRSCWRAPTAKLPEHRGSCGAEPGAEGPLSEALEDRAGDVAGGQCFGVDRLVEAAHRERFETTVEVAVRAGVQAHPRLG